MFEFLTYKSLEYKSIYNNAGKDGRFSLSVSRELYRAVVDLGSFI